MIRLDRFAVIIQQNGFTIYIYTTNANKLLLLYLLMKHPVYNLVIYLIVCSYRKEDLLVLEYYINTIILTRSFQIKFVHSL